MHNRQAMAPRQRLLGGVSALVLGLAAGATPAEAQLARLRTVLGGAVVPTTATIAVPTTVRGKSMQQALAQQQANRASIQSLRVLVTQARDAVKASLHTQPTDGLSTKGLDPAVLKPVLSVNDPSGLATWQGALMPTQTIKAGNYTVQITQTDARAVLSWKNFDVGAKTTLNFDQSVGGVGQTDWVVLNRVVDPKASPTTILGQIKAQGTVLVIDRAGVLFGAGSQVNLHSLLASSLDVGNFGKNIASTAAGSDTQFTGLTIKDRNDAFLQNGLLGTAASPLKFNAMLTSSLAGTGSYDFVDPEKAFSGVPEGDVVFERGATITAGTGGYIIATGPNVRNDGNLSAFQGQVSLQAGRAISFTLSTGAANGVDPDIRGIILRSTTQTGGSALNSGLISVPQGYISLGADLTGSVTNSGLLESTTSVSRNGVVSLTAGHVTIAGGVDAAHAGGISILPDTDGQTVPQGTAGEPPNFKTSRIDIGAAYVSTVADSNSAGVFGPGEINFGANSLIVAPSATVSVGGRASADVDVVAISATRHDPLPGKITVGDGAIIDVSGVKDVQLEASRNAVTISPLKGNELRDTPNYRDINTTGAFTLNGKTVTVDPRITGVRADGVKWVGSPLIEAGSAASQIGVTAAELMTKGGSVTLKVLPLLNVGDLSSVQRIDIAKGAIVDFSGGWVHYNAGANSTTQLIRADGTLVDIADADPNGDYVGIAGAYTRSNTKFGTSQTFVNSVLGGKQADPAYDEGSDAGALIISAPTATIAGTLHGDAFTGARQASTGTIGTAKSAIALDKRALQSSRYELPSGGYVRIGSFNGTGATALGGDILVQPSQSAAASTVPGTIVLQDSLLTSANLSALTLQTTGGVTVADGSVLSLADGGALTIDAGRTITLGGKITARGGQIAARTYEIGGTVLSSLQAAAGSAFTTADDVSSAYAVGAALPNPFDVHVTGTLDVSGTWANNAATVLAGDLTQTTAWRNGGSISLAVAPKAFVYLGANREDADNAADLSGSLLIDKDARLNVSAGGAVSAAGRFDLTAKGGNITLLNETIYASTVLTDPSLTIDTGDSDSLGIDTATQSVTFTPYKGDGDTPVSRALVPLEQRARVVFDASNFQAFSFGGGGTFRLVAPEIAFGSASAAGVPHIGLDFLEKTGFGTLSLSTYRSRVFSDLFSNGIHGNSAFLATTTWTINRGETLNLSQALLPQFLDQSQQAAVRALESGGHITDVLSAVVPSAAWDQRAATLDLGGLTELDVLAGGSITGAAGATIRTTRLLNQGSIKLMGGHIVQNASLTESIAQGGAGVRDEALGGPGLDGVFGPASVVDGHVQYDENAKALVLVNGQQVTNGKLISASGADRAVFFLGRLDQATGIRLDAGSVTDLSGGVVFDPRAPLLQNGTVQATGMLYKGGSISTAAPFAGDDALVSPAAYGSLRYFLARNGGGSPVGRLTKPLAFDALQGSKIDISGAQTAFDIQVDSTSFARIDQWSDAGTLSVGGGGSLTQGTVKALGGNDKAQGGILEWLRPVLSQSGPTAGLGSNAVTADWIEASGFSTFAARGGLSLAGNVDLKLGRALLVSSADPISATVTDSDLQVSIGLVANGNARIEAPYIRLSSRSQNAGELAATQANTGSITFAADAIDLVGGIGISVPETGTAKFVSTGNIRLIGVASPLSEIKFSGLTGSVISSGDLAFTADQVFATTGTGNLQQLIEDQRNGTTASTATPYIVASLAGSGTVSFAGNGGAVPDLPLSAGSWVRVLGANIEQDGVLRAPLGLLEIGGAADTVLAGGLAPLTQSIRFGKDSVTSVSGTGLNVPYGQTTDLTEFYFRSNATGALTAAPVGQVNLTGKSIDVGAGATIDGRGGGDVFAFEFVSGTGGSRDVLSRFNTDSFSSNDGFQYADGRQVYAILPVSKAGQIAAYDPLYSADYGAGGGDLYGSNAGRTVWLDAAPGIAAGEYLLLPAHYALVPGALRLVENTTSAAPFIDSGTTLRDGSIVVGGTFGLAGTQYRESERHSFTVESASVFKRYSRLVSTSGNTTFAEQAASRGQVAPRAPIDAARFVIRPTDVFKVAGTFDLTPGTGGRGAQFDIAAASVEITKGGDSTGSGTAGLVLSSDTLANLNANSLLIGGTRSDNRDGTTAINVVGSRIAIDSGVSLTLPELILAAGGDGSEIRVGSGASIKATGTLADTLTGNYVVGYSALGAAQGADNSGSGSILHVSSGAERQVTRTFDPETGPTGLTSSTLVLGSGALVSGNAIGFETSGKLALRDSATIAGTYVTVDAPRIAFDGTGFDAAVADKLAQAAHLTLRSNGIIRLGAELPDRFNDLIIDAAGIYAANRNEDITAKAVTFKNSGGKSVSCGALGATACKTNRTLEVHATSLTLGDGTFSLFGFGKGVTLGASGGINVSGKGSLALVSPHADLTLLTPYIADAARGGASDVHASGVDYLFATKGKVTVDGTGLTGAASTALSAGSVIAFGSQDAQIAQYTQVNAAVRATSGVVGVVSTGTIAVSGTSSIAAPGFTTTIGSNSDPIVATASGGTVNLQSTSGDITLAKGTALSVDNGNGSGGLLNLIADRGTVQLGASLDAGLAAGKARDASITLSAKTLLDGEGKAFDFGAFVGQSGTLFGGKMQIHTGTGNLALAAGQVLRARSVTLATDLGDISIAGTIDTSGDDVSKLKLTDPAYAAAHVNGGDIRLFGGGGVSLASTARLKAGTTGYGAADSRQASGGNVTLGVSSQNAAVLVAKGAVIDVSAKNTADRAVATAVKDPNSQNLTTAYRIAPGDMGGTVTFRAPVIENDTLVDVRNGGSIVGASSVTLAGFKTFDLDAIAASGAFAGLTGDATGIHLDAAATGKPNFLADTSTSGTLPGFIRNFAVGLRNGDSTAGYRLRPEAVLAASGAITLDSNINLGAGAVTDYAGAVAAGLLTESPLGPDAAGNPRYEVVQGKEGELFSRFVDMTFRVGGKVTGEAGILTMRAGGDLNVANSISDGFFAFHDRTDAAYINHQLGGGDRVYHPATTIDCAAGGTCDTSLRSYSKFADRTLPDELIVLIDLTSSELGEQTIPAFVHSPYSASANSVAANGTGNGIGIGELFPLVGGKAVGSSDIRLVAGAAAQSADPLTVDRARGGSVVISGEKSYSVVAKQGRNTLGGGIQLGVDDGQGEGNILYGNAGSFLTGTLSNLVDPAIASDFYTHLNWGSGDDLADTTRAAAQAFFSGRRFIKEDGEIIGVYAPLGEVTRFLAGDYGTTYASLTKDSIGDIDLGAPIAYDQPKVYYRPLVRTGSGSIAMAAAGNIDLVGPGKVVYRDATGASRDGDGAFEDSENTAQVGSAAVYTAGTRLNNFGKLDLGDQSEPVNYIPSPQGLLDWAPVQAGGGGSVSLVAGVDVRGRRDIASESFLGSGADFSTDLPGYEDGVSTFDPQRVGDASQRWRVGATGTDTEIGLVSQLFTAGVGALAGGNVSISAGRDVVDLTIALNNSVTTTLAADGGRALLSSGAGNLDLGVGRDLLGGQIDLAKGIGAVTVARNVAAAGQSLAFGSYDTNGRRDPSNLLRLRVNDATLSLTARGAVSLGGIGALGAGSDANTAGAFSPVAGVSIATVGKIDLVQNRVEQRVAFMDLAAQGSDRGFLRGFVLPPSLSLTSLGSDILFGGNLAELLYPSRYGQLSLVAAGNLADFNLAMSDANPSDLPGEFTAASFLVQSDGVKRVTGLGFTFGGVYGQVDDPVLRLLHDRAITHAGDEQPIAVYAGGSISNVELNLPKAARINAGLDLINLFFLGQNNTVSDVTSIVAGRDIAATSALPDPRLAVAGRPYLARSNFILGGPGALTVQAGRNLGPFLNSVTIDDTSYGGGIRTIGNEANPWLGTQGADIYALFGVAHGANYDGLRDTYLDPANMAKLDGALFVQNVDTAGNKTPDRSKPIYAPVLAVWLKANAPDAYAAVFGTTQFASDSAQAAAAYAKYSALYQAFKERVPAVQQRAFLLEKIYFGELAAPAFPKGNSYQQYVRGYRAIDTLFPASSGYTDNLSTFTTDPATVTADHPLGVPVKTLVDGQPAVATRVQTGNVDLRLATIGTARGGAVNIIGPGGDFIAGSVVRTSTQAASKSSPLSSIGLFSAQTGNPAATLPVEIDSIPLGYEGVLTLRGGAVRSFTDGDFRLNQSRLFSVNGGDITMWSSNGDLNAGQGPKTASNFPPVSLRFFPNANNEVDSVGSVSGAGIAALSPSVDTPASSVILLAPVGTVDAGDAGVRASGDVFVAAARVANADNFKVGGVSVGVPTTAVVAAPAAPPGANAATSAAAAQARAQEAGAGDRRSIIRVDVLGYIGGNDEACASGRFDSTGKCVR